ncbi:hypothetical protein [Aridibaculum aurantiacum]|uniref:hypothetical protein n=1 Tax=Aridibaculum aurantiacum TaxID=2810307 RepID=UPI001A9694F9|nr:hypothetical protein [Aridibaculum aurantiacum]
MDSFRYFIPGDDGFRADTMDNLLAAGYYRMQHLMFTTNDTQIEEDEEPIPVFWLRTRVSSCQLNRSARNILKKCSQFTTTILPACVTEEIEDLYALYKDHVVFSVSPSCAEYLHTDLLPHPFDSLMVQVRHGAQLVATGFFDVGQQSIAGIMNVYHPAYHAYSLGKFLVLQKLQYALDLQKTYYYTGYISPDSTRFDYKVFPDPTAVEVFLPDQQQWVPYHALGKPFLAEYFLKYLQ